MIIHYNCTIVALLFADLPSQSPSFHDDLYTCYISDMDECVLRIDECHDKYGICNNTDGSYYCSCKTGFTGDGVICDSMSLTEYSLFSLIYAAVIIRC